MRRFYRHFFRSARLCFVLAGTCLILAVALAGVALPAAAAEPDDRDDGDRPCRPHRTEAAPKQKPAPPRGLPELPGPVTTVCVGKHPTDVAIAPELNLAVVANRDGRSVSLVNLSSLQVAGTVPLPARPTGVAADGHLAAVVSPWSDSLFLVDLASPDFSVSSIPLGHGSVDVALDATLRLAVVLDKHRKRVSVVDFRTPDSPTVGEVTLPHLANRITYSPDRGWALVTSPQEHGLLFLIDIASDPSAPVLLQTKALSHALRPHDGERVAPVAIAASGTTDEAVIADREGTLLTYRMGSDLLSQEFAVARGPLRDVAVDPVRNMAVVAGQNDDAFIVDLAARTSIFHVSVGRKPARAAVNGDPTSASAGKAVIVNQKEDSVSIFSMPDVPLRIVALSPSAVPAGNPAFTLSIQGTGFTSSSVVRFGGTVVSSTFTDSTQLEASIPADLVAGAGTVRVTVTVGTQTSLPALFTVFPPQNPVPVIIPPLVPSNVVAGTVSEGDFLQLTIDGDRFLTTSEVRFNGTGVNFHFQSSTQLVAAIPGSLLQTPGTVLVTVTNPAPGGGVATADFPIKPSGNPAGVVTAAIDVGAPTSGIAVDGALGTAVVTLFGDITGTVGNTVLRLSNLTDILPGNPPAPLGDPITVGQSPTGAAVNPSTHIALISNFLDGTASFVDLSAGAEVPARANAGLGPQGVAVDPINTATYRAGIGAVANLFEGTLTVVDLSTHLPTSVIPAADLGAPTGVAFHSATHLAVIADESTAPGMAVLVDLTNPVGPVQVARIPVGNSPARVAIDPTRNLALVTNQDDGTVSVINLTTKQEIARLAVGRQPFGIAIDEALGIAVVVNRQDATLSLIDLKTSPPVVLPLSVNLPFVPTEVAMVPGISGALRLLTTDVASPNVGVVEINASVLP